MQKGLQSVAPSPCAYLERLLSPSSLFHIYNDSLSIILTDRQKKVQHNVLLYLAILYPAQSQAFWNNQ